MNGCGWSDCPTEVKNQAYGIRDYLLSILGRDLIGIYIHGSMSLGSFHPSHSDLDLIIVIHRTLSAQERFQLMSGFLQLHKRPIPLELSILAAQELKPWTHPSPFQFHFSEYWREKYEQVRVENNVSFWAYENPYTDGDLACHISLINQCGICIYGEPIANVFPQVPERDFWNSISSDLDHYRNLRAELLVTGVLTLVRVWSYKVNNEILSKAQAGEWAVRQLPAEYRPIMNNAIDAYYGQAEPQIHHADKLEAFANYVINKIYEYAGK